MNLYLLQFQKQIKNKLKFLNNIKNELLFINKSIESLTNRIRISLSIDIISQTKFNNSMMEIEEVFNKYKNITKKEINCKYLAKKKNYNVVLEISKIKLDLINIIKTCGAIKIEHIIKLILNSNELKHLDKFKNIFNLYNNYFNPTSFILYTKNEEIDLIKADSNIDKNLPICLKNKDVKISLIEKILGANIFIPIYNKLILIKGYFNQDPMNITRLNGILKKKNKKLISLSNNINNIPENFKSSFIEQISLRDFIVLNESELVNKLENSYKKLIKLKKKNISNIVKEFLTQTIENQIETISLFLLNKDDNDTQYLAYLMYDMISNESYLLKPQPLAEKVYYSLHWSIKKLFKIAFKKINKKENNNINFTEDKIPYDKRIHLMKTNDYVKNKAYTKLKEINSSKGETNAKAQQYLDGLLKIPFGIYKKSSIINIFDEYILDLNNYCNFIIKLIDENSNLEIFNFCNEFKKYDNYNSKYLENFLNKIKELLIEYLREKIINKLKFYKNKKLKLLLNNNNLSTKGKKDKLIKTVVDNIFCVKDKDLKSINQDYQLITKTSNLIKNWDSYVCKRKEYLINFDNILDNAVFGMEEAKLQIKRIVAQWINGKDDGYVFGFEGPPGTGKTTLAKKGIAHAIQSIGGEPRPFIFIALGGSSNGSTLEGHNYTYVGSTWGKIVDSLIETQCMNPIIYIDELDKVSKTEHGKELIGILIHMTDPSQNDSFMDKYFSGIKIDISKCLIIFSYNDPNNIDKILLDRIHRIKTKQLSRYDKIQIVNHYMLPEILKSVGFNKNDVLLDEEILLYIIDTYTNEAGVRKLKEKLFEIIREMNLKYLLGEITNFPLTINQQIVDDLFKNKYKIMHKKINESPMVGLVNGLYASSSGLGGITIIETTKFLAQNKLNLELTGQQGDVMKESMKVAKTVAYNLLTKNQKNKLKKEDNFGIHIHCPEAATPKDGPSAGAAITLAIYSLLTKQKINNIYAITGEIDLNGHVLAIGGLELKVEGAKKAGVQYVLCPKENENDLQKIRNGKYPPEDENFKIILVENIQQVLKLMLM